MVSNATAPFAEKCVRLRKSAKEVRGKVGARLVFATISDGPGMSTEKLKRQTQDLENYQNQADCQGLGLVAIGAAGSWELSVDETTSGAAKWFVQIEGPQVYIYFEIPSPKVIDQTIAFIERRAEADQVLSPGLAAQSGSLCLGALGCLPIMLEWDNEDRNRWFFVIGQTVQPTVRISILDGDFDEFTQALRQVREELQGEDLL